MRCTPRFGLLALLVVLGCAPEGGSPSPVEAAPAPVADPAPSWSDDLAGVTLVAPDSTWRLASPPALGGLAEVRVSVDATCSGYVWRSRLADRPSADRGAALTTRILERVAAAGVTDIVTRDQGEVPHGEFRAQMLRLDGRRGDAPWSARITATFVTRPSGRFYVEIGAVATASGFVRRRTCYDTVTASVSIHREGR